MVREEDIDLGCGCNAHRRAAPEFGVIRDEEAFARLRQYRPAHPYLVHVEIEQITLRVHCRTSDDRDVEAEMPHRLDREVSDEATIRAAQCPTGDDDAAIGVGGEDVGHVHVVRHHQQITVLQQGAGNRLRARADVEKKRSAFGNIPGTAPRNGSFGVLVERAAFGVADVDRAGWQDSTPVHPFEFAAVRQFGKIAPDCLQCDPEMGGKRVHRYFPVAAGDGEDVGMSDGL